MDKPLHYEIHITVKTDNTPEFIRQCEAVGVKPIVLDLQKSDGSSGIQDVMTSSKITGDDYDAFQKMVEVSHTLTDKGFNVVREKIETVPWHPKALVHDGYSTENYFETHIPVLIKEDEVEGLAKVAKFLKLHLSRNAFKKLSNGYVVQFITLRTYTESLITFKFWMKYHMEALYKYGYSFFEEPEIEYALYDSKVNHDAEWIAS
jgi:hypothetical protein